MTQEERKPTGLLNSAGGLRQLLIDNPNLPLVVFVSKDANYGGDYNYTSYSCVSARLGEFLDCSQMVNDCRCYCDRDNFQEDLEHNYADFDGSDDEFEIFIENQVMEYEPYWKDCIILWVDKYDELKMGKRAISRRGSGILSSL